MAEQFTCRIKRMFNNCPKPDGWFGCFAVRDDDNSEIKLTGHIQTPAGNGVRLEIEAVCNEAKDEYKASSVKVLFKAVKDLRYYLYCVLPRNKVDALIDFGKEQTLALIQQEPQIVVDNCSAITQADMTKIQNSLSVIFIKDSLKQVAPFLTELQMKNLIEKANVSNIVQKIKDDPYWLLSQKIPWHITDKIALHNNVDPVGEYRIENAMCYQLHQILKQEMDLFLMLSDADALFKFMVSIQTLLNIQFQDVGQFGNMLMNIASKPGCRMWIDWRQDMVCLYETKTLKQAVRIAKSVQNMSTQSAPVTASNSELNAIIREYETDNGMKLLSEQKDAVKSVFEHKLSIVTGGPGRGKTRVVDCICYTYCKITHSKRGTNIVLLAPTGKAVKKLKKDTGNKYRTETVDRFLLSEEFAEMAKRQQRSHVFLVIDESSMLDLDKISRLFTLNLDLHLCFIGDPDQLPPIGRGCVFQDMLNSGAVTTTTLITAVRNKGVILANADKIKVGDTSLTYDINEMPLFAANGDGLDTLDLIIDTYADELVNGANNDISEIALISPVNKGLIGTRNLNMKLQEMYCPLNTSPSAAVPVFSMNHQRDFVSAKGVKINSMFFGTKEEWTNIRIGDVIMVTKNDPTITIYKYENDDFWKGKPTSPSYGIANGDVGRVFAYEPLHKEQDAEGNDIEVESVIIKFFDGYYADLNISAGEAKNIQLGYACTVHKAQGSEYKTVIYVSPESMMYMRESFACRNMVYTAITRAKEKAIVIGSKNSLETCIHRQLPKRNSVMQEWMQPGNTTVPSIELTVTIPLSANGTGANDDDDDDD